MFVAIIVTPRRNYGFAAETAALLEAKIYLYIVEHWSRTTNRTLSGEVKQDTETYFKDVNNEFLHRSFEGSANESWKMQGRES